MDGDGQRDELIADDDHNAKVLKVNRMLEVARSLPRSPSLQAVGKQREQQH